MARPKKAPETAATPQREAQIDGWLSVDRAGLAYLIERRGRAQAVIELVSNGWDQKVTNVDVRLASVNDHFALLTVTDDDPDGFADLRDAYTLFKHTAKRARTDVRGRFNMGEKLMLALCVQATISTTTGTVLFAEDGTRIVTEDRRAAGSCVQATIKLSREEVEEVGRIMDRLIPPGDVETYYNGRLLRARKPLLEFTAPNLGTEREAEDGRVIRTTGSPVVRLYRPQASEGSGEARGWLYEMGIPVVETGDTFDVDVLQKVPLNVDRDNVTPAWLTHLRVLTLNASYRALSEEEATAGWVKEAMGDPRVDAEAVNRIMALRFGDRRVIFDPSDVEGSKRAMAEGYTVIAPRSLSKAEWEQVRRVGAAQRAGLVTPSDKIVAGSLLDMPGLEEAKLSEGMRSIRRYATDLGRLLINCEVSVSFVVDVTANYLASFGGQHLTFNVGRLGRSWFDQGYSEAVDELLLHEFAHHFGGHLDSGYHDALARLGARLRRIPLPGVVEAG